MTPEQKQRIKYLLSKQKGKKNKTQVVMDIAKFVGYSGIGAKTHKEMETFKLKYTEPSKIGDVINGIKFK